MLRSKILMGVLVVLFTCHANAQSVVVSQPITTQNPLNLAIEKQLKSSQIIPEWPAPLQMRDALKKYYSQYNFESLWSPKHELNLTAVKQMVSTLQESVTDGLNPADYHLDAIENWVSQFNSKKSDDQFVAQLDLILSDTFLNFASDVAIGRIIPNKYYADWFYEPKEVDLAGLLQEAVAKNAVARVLKELYPTDQRYLEMRAVLKRFQDLAKNTVWPKVPQAGKKWELGHSGPHIAALRERLVVSGELRQTKTENPELFDDALAEAVSQFQKQQGLNSDGVVGIFTWQALNVSLDERVRQIKLNMERLRWLPRDLGEKHIFVNIPDYNVKLVEKGKTTLVLKSVVGNTKWRTPVFKDEMESVVLNPRWNVPPKITKKETLPKIKEDPNYINRMNFSVFKNENGKRVAIADPATVDWSQAEAKDYFFSQRSGGGNALGRMKFMFPNKHSIYIHDTPSKYLFKRDIRAYSHGCIRLENPIELAKTILSGIEKWNAAKIEKVIKSNEWTTVNLPKKIPIHLYYLTAWVDTDGALQFRKDIYGYDKTLARVLKL